MIFLLSSLLAFVYERKRMAEIIVRFGGILAFHFVTKVCECPVLDLLEFHAFIYIYPNQMMFFFFMSSLNKKT